MKKQITKGFTIGFLLLLCSCIGGCSQQGNIAKKAEKESSIENVTEQENEEVFADIEKTVSEETISDVDTEELMKEWEFWNRRPAKVSIEKYILQDKSLYGVMQNGEVALMEWDRDWGNRSDFETIIVPERVEGYLVTVIAEDAIRSETVTEIVLPESIRVLEESAIAFCPKLQKINIPNAIEIIGDYNFTGDGDYPLNWLKELAEKNENGMAIINGHLLYCNTDAECIVVPENIKAIVEPGFWQDDTKEVILPEGLKVLHSMPYYVEEMNIPYSVVDFGRMPYFYRNSTLFQKQTVEGMFIVNGILLYSEQRTGEVTVPDNVWSIGEEVFREHRTITSELESVILPDSVIIVGDSAFSDCVNLNKIVLGNSIRSIGAYAFSECTTLEDIVLPMQISEIKDGTFRNCEKLKDVEIPSGVNVIGLDAFLGCMSLVKINIPSSVTAIHAGAFSDCISLNKAVIPDSVRYIEKAAFANCNNLKYIKIGNGVQYIGEEIFGYRESGQSGIKSEMEDIMEEIVIELQDRIPVYSKKYRESDAEIEEGYKMLEKQFALQKRKNVVFVVKQSTEMEEIIKNCQIENGVKQYEYQYHSEATINNAKVY